MEMLSKRAQNMLSKRVQSIIDSYRERLSKKLKEGKLGDTSYSYSEEEKQEFSENAKLALNSLMKEGLL